VSAFGLVTYVWVLVRPRAAFERLKNAPTWGWAAVIGLLLTLAAFLIAEPAQLHVLATSESHRIAALPPNERVRAQIVQLHIAQSHKTLFIVGALVGPWITWFLTALFFFMAAAISRARASFGMAWVVALNSYVVYALGGVANAALLATRDPNHVDSGLDLIAMPSLGWLFPHNPAIAAFLSAYGPFNIWYYAIVAVALIAVLKVPRSAAVVATIGYSLLLGFFATSAVVAPP
jgi:hypothetical protein